jgi:hypothetical protein
MPRVRIEWVGVVGLADDPAAGAAAGVEFVAHRHERLRREHDVVAASGEGLADDASDSPAE